MAHACKRWIVSLALVASAVLVAGCGGEAAGSPHAEGGSAPSASIVETACGQCQFDLPAEGCDLAVRIDGVAWFVEGTSIDDHGDAHARDGFCNAIRKARVTGEVVGDRFEVESFELLPGEG